MERDYEQLQRKIEEGLDAVRELKRRADEQKREERPKFRLIRGGMIGGVIWAGVEWLRNYKIAVALAATAVAVVGAIAEQPHSPGADPPPHASVRPTVKPKPPAPSLPPPATVRAPRRTSPPTVQRSEAKAPPAKTAPRKSSPPAVTPQKTATPKKTVTPKVIPTIIPTIVTTTPEEACTGIGLLGLCVLGN